MHDTSQHRTPTTSRISALCALLVPVLVVVATRFTDDGGLSRVLLAWLIAMCTGLAVYASAAASPGTSD